VTRLCPTVRFVGVAGPRLVQAGCWPIFDMTRHAAMLVGAVGLVGRACRMLGVCEAYLRRFPFDAAVVVDSPTLHLPLAGRIRARGIPVLYYIAPQMWAWGKHRMTKLRARVDRVACILPFEEAFFRAEGIDATYVGHPVVERMAAGGGYRSNTDTRSEPSPQGGAPVGDPWPHRLETGATQSWADRSETGATQSSVDRSGTGATHSSPLRLETDTRQSWARRRGAQPFIALLPGSRAHVISEVLPGQLEVARAILAAYPKAGVGVSVAGADVRRVVEQHARAASVPVTLHEGDPGPLIEASDLVLVASGTTTLHVVLRRKPMIVMYNASRLAYQLVARWMIRTKHLSLPNILAGREIVPEFMPSYRSTRPIIDEALRLLADEGRRAAMVADLDAVASRLGGGASERTARLLLDMIGAPVAVGEGTHG
jgi:lipid-A-disaccharide synthase